MTQRIVIADSLLTLPDGTHIPDCWSNRTAGVLSKAASVALMPFINAEERQATAYEDLRCTFALGDPAYPVPPDDLYAYSVDGNAAYPAKLFAPHGALRPSGVVTLTIFGAMRPGPESSNSPELDSAATAEQRNVIATDGHVQNDDGIVPATA